MKLENYGFSVQDLDLAKSKIQSFKAKKGEVFYNDFCYGFVSVLSGELKVYASSENREIALFSLKSGDECLVCADCLDAFGSRVRIEVASECVFESLPAGLFKDLKAKYPLFANHILSLLAGRFYSSVSVLSVALFAPLKERILDFLRQNSQNGVCVCTHAQIANELGSVREAISRVLKELEKAGIIRQKRGEITLL